ncbi:Hypothetical protein PBC10988_35730 [Planctomycetales bacterium 10988]|nr:Hypothetical protein PBC10988_35730 [Planctomycetales bacterium 10988]
MRHLFLSILLLLLAICFRSTAANPPSGSEFPIVKTIPAIDADGLEIPEQELKLSNEDGWFVVTLTALPKELEFKIVLAKITPDHQPKITIHPQLPLFSVQYGPWFVRESLGRLRVYREPKDPKSEAWKQIGTAPEGETPCTAGRLFVVQKDDWLWLCTSPQYNRQDIDTLIRFQHQSLKTGHGSMLFADGKFGEVFCGEARCHDEGDLLVASRITTYGAKALLSSLKPKESLANSKMPSISGEQVNKKGIPTTQDALKGRVVLVDFWATWCGPCVRSLPKLNALSAKYKERGLVVVGIHSAQNAENLREFLTVNDLEFPILVDDGDTAKRFGVVQLPTYFLIGRDGRMKRTAQTQLPTEEQIELELDKAFNSADSQ